MIKTWICLNPRISLLETGSNKIRLQVCQNVYCCSKIISKTIKQEKHSMLIKNLDKLQIFYCGNNKQSLKIQKWLYVSCYRTTSTKYCYGVKMKALHTPEFHLCTVTYTDTATKEYKGKHQHQLSWSNRCLLFVSIFFQIAQMFNHEQASYL